MKKFSDDTEHTIPRGDIERIQKKVLSSEYRRPSSND